MSENQNWDGPGAAIAQPAPAKLPTPIQVIEGAGGHTLEPDYKRVPVGPDHPLYPVMVSLALFPILMGSAGHHLADDMPEEDTHPFFPDHFWPYPIIAVIMMVTVGLLAAFVQTNMLLEASADPRVTVVPRPDWYFLFLFQFLKLGPELLTALVIPPVALGILLVWPFIDGLIGPRLARRLGWRVWPKPGKNWITGTIWVATFAFIGFLTFWAMAGFTLFGITGG